MTESNVYLAEKRLEKCQLWLVLAIPAFDVCMDEFVLSRVHHMH